MPAGYCTLHLRLVDLVCGYYSIVSWGIFSWRGIVALAMFLETQFRRYPANGFSVVCAYLFGWAYIWFTMIPIGLIYLLFRGIQILWQKRE